MMSRFWYVLLAVVLAVAMAVVMITRSTANRAADTAMADALLRDRLEVELWMRLDARARLDAIALIAAQPDVAKMLRAASSSKRISSSVSQKISSRLRKLNGQLDEVKGDLLFVVDRQGREAGSISRSGSRSVGHALVPLVTDALRGYQVDDVWRVGKHAYRMAARPVIDNGRYVGALVHGIKFDERLARRLVQRLGGASIALFSDGALLAGATGKVPDAVSPEKLVAGLGAATEDEGFVQGRASEVVPLEQGAGVYSLVAGSASDVGVGYALGRPTPPRQAGFFGNPSKQDVEATNWVPVAAIPAALGLLGLLVLYFERDKPIRNLAAQAALARDGQVQAIDLKGLRGKYRRLAEDLNLALNGRPDAPQGLGNVGDLNNMVQATRQQNDEAPSYFGFATEPKSEIKQARPPSPPLAPEKTPPPKPKAAEFASPVDEDEETATMVAEIPDELIAAATAAIQGHTAEDEKHFREVFEQFSATQKECGEPDDGVPYEKFASKLRATRMQILETHAATGVRFTVYVKDGKAALKANPIKV